MPVGPRKNGQSALPAPPDGAAVDVVRAVVRRGVSAAATAIGVSFAMGFGAANGFADSAGLVEAVPVDSSGFDSVRFDDVLVISLVTPSPPLNLIGFAAPSGLLGPNGFADSVDFESSVNRCESAGLVDSVGVVGDVFDASDLAATGFDAFGLVAVGFGIAFGNSASSGG